MGFLEVRGRFSKADGLYLEHRAFQWGRFSEADGLYLEHRAFQVTVFSSGGFAVFPERPFLSGSILPLSS